MRVFGFGHCGHGDSQEVGRRAWVAPSLVFAVALLSAMLFGGAVARAEEGPEAACAPATETTAECLSVVVPEGAFPSYEGSGERGGFAPKDLRSAYKLPATGGSDQTIAIVDAFDDPNAESDLKAFRSHYGLSECTTANGCFKKVNQKGETKNYPGANVGWAVEISLDLDMASAICPECHILLVEANNNFFENLAIAEDEAATLKASEISNSWGGLDLSARVAEDSHYNHAGIPILAAAGDSGYKTEFPASVPTVISVGGTVLKTAENSREWSEIVWKKTGSGCSPVQSKPAWQTDSGCSKRTQNDVAAVASLETPVSVYDTYSREGWLLIGGTSVSTPVLAGVEALSSSTARSLGAEAFYKAGPAGRLFDITEGSNGSCGTYLCEAKIGYDGPSGWGVPNGVIAVSPSAVTKAAAGVTGVGATLNGTLNPAGTETKYYFEYGKTTSYGTKTAEVSAGSGTSDLEMAKAVSGLSTSTTYHFRIVATSSVGTTKGEDKTFTTTKGTAVELSGMAVSEPFNGSEASKANYAANWSKLGWASEKGNDTTTGWRPNGAFPIVNGAFGSTTVTDVGSGVAAVVTMAEEPLNPERYFSLWLDASGTSSTRTGYELRFTAASSGGPGYEITIYKWLSGAQTVLTSNSHYSPFAIGSSLALVDQGSTVSAWINTGAGFSELLSASDAAFEGGKAGIEGVGNRTHLTNFKVGVL